MNTTEYNTCVKNPDCNRGGGRGAKFLSLTCPVCGKVFRIAKSRYKIQPQTFCSRECFYDSRFGKDRPRYNEKYSEEIDRLLYGAKED